MVSWKLGFVAWKNILLLSSRKIQIKHSLNDVRHLHDLKKRNRGLAIACKNQREDVTRSLWSRLWNSSKLTMLLLCSISIRIFFTYSIQYSFMFHLKLNDMSTILQEYGYNYSLSCNMIGTIIMVIVGSIRTSLLGIILMITGIAICIM